MAHLSPRKPRLAPSTGNAKSAHIEIYPVSNFEFKGQLFDTGFVFVLIGSKMLASRKDVPGDKTLRFLSGLCANDLSKHPSWEPALNADLPPNTQLGYLLPTHASNCSKWTDGETTAPGAWVFQGAAVDIPTLLKLLEAVFTHAFFNQEGWTQLVAMKTLQRQVNVPPNSWVEQLQIYLAPRGSFCLASASQLAAFVARHPWLRVDGCLAHAESGGGSSDLPFDLSSPEEVEAALTARDRMVIHEGAVNAIPAQPALGTTPVAHLPPPLLLLGQSAPPSAHIPQSPPAITSGLPPALMLGASPMPPPAAALPTVEAAAAGVALLAPPVPIELDTRASITANAAPVHHASAIPATGTLGTAPPAFPPPPLLCPAPTSQSAPAVLPPSHLSTTVIVPKLPAPHSATLPAPVVALYPPRDVLQHQSPETEPPCETPASATATKSRQFPLFARQQPNQNPLSAPAVSFGKRMTKKGPVNTGGAAAGAVAIVGARDQNVAAIPQGSDVVSPTTEPPAIADSTEQEAKLALGALDATRDMSIKAGNVLLCALQRHTEEVMSQAQKDYANQLPVLRANKDLTGLRSLHDKKKAIANLRLPDEKNAHQLLLHPGAWKHLGFELSAYLTTLATVEAASSIPLQIVYAFVQTLCLEPCFKFGFVGVVPPELAHADSKLIAEAIHSELHCEAAAYNVTQVALALSEDIIQPSISIQQTTLEELWGAEHPDVDMIEATAAKTSLLQQYTPEVVAAHIQSCSAPAAKVRKIAEISDILQPALPAIDQTKFQELYMELQASVPEATTLDEEFRKE